VRLRRRSIIMDRLEGRSGNLPRISPEVQVRRVIPRRLLSLNGSTTLLTAVFLGRTSSKSVRQELLVRQEVNKSQRLNLRKTTLRKPNSSRTPTRIISTKSLKLTRLRFSDHRASVERCPKKRKISRSTSY